MNRKQLISPAIFHWQSRSWCSTSNYQDEALTKVYNILEKVNPIEPALEPLSPKLSRSLVACLVQNPPNPQSGLRFFIWATRRRRFWSRELQELVCNMLVQEGGFDLYWKTLQELRKGKVSISSDAFRVLIMGYWRIGDAGKAIEVFENMRDYDCQPNVLAYNAILHIMVQKDMTPMALPLLTLMLKSSCSPNAYTYNIWIDGLLKSGKSQDALCLFNEMYKDGIYPNNFTYSILLSGLCQAKWEDTAQVLDRMSDSGCQPDEITYKSLLNNLCRLGRFDKACMLLSWFRKEGYDLCIKGYSCIIDGLFKARRFQEACQWFYKFLKESGSGTPDVVLYSIMIKGLSNAGRINGAKHLMKEMADRGLARDTQCYNALIKGCCDLGLWDDALSLRLEMDKYDCFPNTYTHTILIRARRAHGLDLNSTQIFEEMEKSGCSPSVVTFNTLIKELCKAGDYEKADYEKALELINEMGLKKPHSLLPLHLQEGTLKRLTDGDCAPGSLYKYYRLLTRMADNKVVPDITTYNTLIDSMCKNNNIDEAYNLVRKLESEGLKPDSVTYGTLIDGLCRVKKVENAIKRLDLMTNSEILLSSSPYKSLMTWLCRNKRVSDSFAPWLKYLRRFKKWDDGEVKLLEDRFEKGDDLVEAINALLEMDLKKKEFDLCPYTIWLIGLCQAERVEEALKVFHILKEYKINVTPPSCVWLIKCLCRKEKLRKEKLRKEKLEAAVNVFHYTVEKGLILEPHICNVLVESLLDSPSTIKRVFFDLQSRMESIGYDVNSHLYEFHRLFNGDQIADGVSQEEGTVER